MKRADNLKFIEFGIGNTWFVRTETELADGTEYEEQGIVGPIHYHSLYVRIWVRKTVFIFDTKDGFKRTEKKRNAIKILFGIAGK